MKTSYNRLGQYDRFEIEKLLALGKNNIEFANNAFEEIKRRKHCVAIALDISGFFDNLDHQRLKGGAFPFTCWSMNYN